LIEVNLLGSAEQRRTSAALAPSRLPKLPASAGDPTTAALGGLGLLLLLWMGYSFWSLGSQTAELQTQLDQELADSTRLAATMSRTELLRARQDTIQKRIEVIRGVDERRYVWPHLMDEISRALPAFTWLTKVAGSDVASADGAAPGFNLEGNAASTQSLTQFMKNLEMSPFIRGVTLVTTAQQEAEGHTFQKFTLEAQYETPDSSVVRTVPVVSAP